MSFDLKRLYELLPAWHRQRDTEAGKQMLSPADKIRWEQLQARLNSLANPEGREAAQIRNQLAALERGPLQALLAIIAEQVAVLEEDLDQLYEDQFIETCAEWVVPYIGDLIGVRGLVALPDAPFSQRAQVANTITYRRRKGTAAVVEQLARDVTGWNANVVEYFQLLATTQYLNHLRPENIAIASLKQEESLEKMQTPFDTMARTVDVRSIGKRRGKYNIPNIGIFLWRLNSYAVTQAPAFKVDNRRYLFDALGKNIPLYNLPQTEDEITHLAEPVNVPMPITRRVLNRDLEIYYGIGKSLCIYINGKEILPGTQSPPESPPATEILDFISICNLSDTTDAGGNAIWANLPRHKIAIDPVLGRLAFPAAGPLALPDPQSLIQVTYHYGFSAEIGGGEYDRVNSFSGDLQSVIKRVPSDEPTIQKALNELAVSGGVVEIEHNDYYFETPVITVAAGTKIELRAADKRRPVLVVGGIVTVLGGGNAELIFNGLFFSGGQVQVPAKDPNGQDNQLRRIRFEHCTLLTGPSPAIQTVPAQPVLPRLVVELPGVIVELSKSIIGGLRVDEGASVIISNSIVDALEETAFSGLTDQEPGASLQVENSTVIGKVHTRLLEMASNTIFLAPVIADRLQEGCARFSYFPQGSSIPRSYHCQPATAGDAARVRPVFTSLRYGDAGYCQLSAHCAAEIRQGADDEAEMGVFHHLYQPQREANLQARLEEYLRFGLEAGIYYGS